MNAYIYIYIYIYILSRHDIEYMYCMYSMYVCAYIYIKEKYRQENQSWIQTLVQKILLFFYLFSIFLVF